MIAFLRSLFHPETAEDAMQWVPLLGCCLPLAIVVITAVVFIVRAL